jgi:hypothetical protein
MNVCERILVDRFLDVDYFSIVFETFQFYVVYLGFILRRLYRDPENDDPSHI